MASNSTISNEGGSGSDINNSHDALTKAATWKLLSEYNNKFDNNVDYIEFTKTVQQATGASDAVISSAMLYRMSPYSNKPKATTTTQATNPPRGPFELAAAAAAKRNNTTTATSLSTTTNTNASTSEDGVSQRRRHVPALHSSTDNRGGDRRSIRVQPRDANQQTLNFSIGNDGDGGGGSDDNESDDEDTERNHRREDNARRRKAVEERAQSIAIDKIQKYIQSFPNGAIDNVLAEDDLDSDGGYASEPNDNNTNNKRGKGTRRSYIPKSGSAIKEYLDQVKEKVAPSNNNKTTPLDLTAMSPWIPPPNNPLSAGLGQSAEPSKFYLSDTWVYIYEPMMQYQRLMPQKYECIHCKSKRTKFHSWDWKPYHWWDKIVYVLHHWVQCNDCASCFRTVDPKCISTLPTRVAAQFPFVSPNQYGPGIYAPMITMLVALMPNSILFGSFTKVINTLLHVNFAQTHLAYLKEAAHWKNIEPPVIVSCGVVTPFSPFADQSGYCGVDLKENLVRGGLRVFMDTHENYMQMGFQYAADDGCSSDDSHKLTNHIYASVGKKKVKPFTATYTIMGKNGLPNVSRFKFTKSACELKAVIPAWVESRVNAGRNELLRLESDNAAGDSSVQLSASSSLMKGVLLHEETTSLPRFRVTKDDFKYISTREGMKSLALVVVSHLEKIAQDGGTMRIGLDTEFDNNGVYVLALHFGDNVGITILVHNLSSWGNTFESTMKTILEHKNVVIVGCNVAVDVQKLRELFGISFKRIRDVGRYSLHDDPNQSTSLQTLAARYLGFHVNKDHQRDNFNVQPPLVDHLQIYAVSDAILPLKIDTAITDRLINTGVNTHRHIAALTPGTEVIIRIGRVDAAVAKIEMIGERGSGAGETSMWGSLYIGANKATVKIITVLARGAKLPFQHSSWERKLTMGEMSDLDNWDDIIAVRTSQIHRRLLAVNQRRLQTVCTGDTTTTTGMSYD